MAPKLFLTERAVEMRRSAIMKKLQVRSVAELVELTTTHRMLTEFRQARSSGRFRQNTNEDCAAIGLWEALSEADRIVQIL